MITTSPFPGTVMLLFSMGLMSSSRLRWRSLAWPVALVLQTAMIRADQPVVVYSQRLPETPMFVSGLAVDASGIAYLLRGRYYAGGAYVSKVDASGVLWTVRIGGATAEQSGSYLEPAGIAIDPSVDPAGNAYVTGFTSSADFPLAAPLQSSLHGKRDAFILKINPAGTLIYSTYLGGLGDQDGGRAIAVDPAGNVYVAGDSDSPVFRGGDCGDVAICLRPASAASSDTLCNADVFITKLDASGHLVYSTFLGGSGSTPPPPARNTLPPTTPLFLAKLAWPFP